MAQLGLVVGLAFALLLGCGHSTGAVDQMASDPLSKNHIRGLEEVDQRKEGAHTTLGKHYASKFVRVLRPGRGRIDQRMIDRVAAVARRAGWTAQQTSAGGYRGRKTIGDLDVALTIAGSHDEREIAILMVALNEPISD